MWMSPSAVYKAGFRTDLCRIVQGLRDTEAIGNAYKKACNEAVSSPHRIHRLNEFHGLGIIVFAVIEKSSTASTSKADDSPSELMGMAEKSLSLIIREI